MPTTIFTNTLPSDDSGNEGFSFRQRVALTGGSQGQTRVTFKANSTVGWKVDHCSFGKWTGTSANGPTTTTPKELTFSGASGFSIAAGGTITSDFVSDPASYTSSDSLIVIMDFTAGGTLGNEKINNGPVTGADLQFNAASASYNVASPTGYTDGGAVVAGVSLIEVQAAGSIIPVFSESPQLTQMIEVIGW